ncbi:MAG: tRNA (guanosine(37)-N1)-methyltransferase TrmD [Patescibacteria group bacterium]|nr:tRNA (guanosine(37)-N1)-methyltransferase TrmD [Patescibacteria group bacterium]
MAKDKLLKVDVLTLFPEMIDAYCNASILGRAQKNKLLQVKAHDLRRWAIDKHGHVDDRPFGGGAGMVMRVEPFYKALKQLKVPFIKGGNKGGIKTRVILTSAKGKLFTQKDAQRLAKYDRLVFLCGRYEGVDERVATKLADEELSIGPYVMTGGELAALVVTDAVARLRQGVLGQKASLDEESWSDGVTKEYPQYTRPEVFGKWKVPPVLLSGDHKKIAEWRKKNQK